MTYSYYWTAKNASPRIKLNAGTTAAGKRKIKSVSIRNIAPSVLDTVSNAKGALNNIIGTIIDNNPFSYSIYEVIVNGDYRVEVS